MIGTDLQLKRIQVILAADRPQPEPDEAEVRRVLEHLGASPEATTAEARQ
jgi:hypothetical protein